MTINAIDALNKLAMACDPCNETMELVRIIRAALSAPSDDETYDIGFKEGYEDAVQSIDIATGGDGEYRYSEIPDRHCPDANVLLAKIIDRFQKLSAPAVTNGGLQDFACKVSDMLWGGELGWARTGLDRMFNELKKRISSPAVPVIDGLDEAIKNLSDCKNASWVELNGEDVNDLMKLLKAARAYAELQKGA